METKKMIKNILLTIEYDGTGFSGWQIQPQKRTVQGEIQRCLEKICGIRVEISGTGRTDAGVHALGQRASFKGEFGIPVERMARVMNNLLPGDIKILEVKEMPESFHARFDAKGKTYVYKILNSSEKNVFMRNYFYCLDRFLDAEKMAAAAEFFIGTHDFAAFMSAGSTPQKTTVRTIYDYRVKEVFSQSGERQLHLEVTGDGFLYNMVRIMTGTLVEVGLGKLKPEDISGIIQSGERSRAGRTAPPQGLYLAEVYFNAEDFNRFR